MTTHSTSAATKPQARLVIAGSAAMIAVLLSPTASMARQQATSTGLKSLFVSEGLRRHHHRSLRLFQANRTSAEPIICEAIADNVASRG